jgi:hypothetical protein
LVFIEGLAIFIELWNCGAVELCKNLGGEDLELRGWRLVLLVGKTSSTL